MSEERTMVAQCMANMIVFDVVGNIIGSMTRGDMELEKQVVGLELSKRLKELGTRQESYFYWNDGDKETNPVVYHYNMEFMLSTEKMYSAFTVAELGEMMKGQGMGTSAYSKMQKNWWITGGEWIVEKQKYAKLIENENESNLRAKMLIYLIESKLMEPPK